MVSERIRKPFSVVGAQRGCPVIEGTASEVGKKEPHPANAFYGMLYNLKGIWNYYSILSRKVPKLNLFSRKITLTTAWRIY